MFATHPLEPAPADQARRRIRGALPPYNPMHLYTFVLDTGLTTPGQLHFGVGDRGFDDNTGAFQTQVAQLQRLR